MATILGFRDLNTWKESHKLVLLIYKYTSDFPKTETFGLTDQMRRASVSISSNIAEGFSRQGKKEKLQFYYIAKGSLTEIENQIIISRDLKSINLEEYNEAINQIETVGKLITGLSKSVSSRS